jgi:DNA-binding beta-propeller fold protein YncE
LSDPSGVAVSEVGVASGDVYVVDRGNDRVEQFDSSGGFLAAWGWGVSDGEKKYEVCRGSEGCVAKVGTPGSGKGREKFSLGTGRLVSPEAVAVDDSPSSVSGGDVYVVADVVPEHSFVYKFGPEGEYKRRLTSVKESEAYGRPEGVAVDAEGVVWVDWSGGEISKFTDAEPNTRVKNKSKEVEEVEAGVGPLRPGLAVDSEDDVYVNYEPGEKFAETTNEASRESEEGRGEGGSEPCEGAPCVTARLVGVAEPVLELFPGEPVIEELDGAQSTSGLAVDEASGKGTPLGEAGKGDVYLDHGSSVAVFDTRGSLVQRFGSEGAQDERLKAGSAVAVDSQTGDVYVADDATDRVDVFTPESLGTPMIDGLSSRDVSSESVGLDAQIDPRGSQTSYYFEYGTASCASPASACVRTPVAVMGSEGYGDEGVSAVLGSGAPVAPGTTYYYRVAAENKQDVHVPVLSGEGTFSTPPAGGQFVADGRFWELVSPPDKGGAVVEAITREAGVIQAAADGGAITYVTDGPVSEPGGPQPEGSRSLEVTQVISSRGQGGWSSRDIVTPNEHGTGIEMGLTPPEYEFFSLDLSLALVDPFQGGGRLAEPPLSPPASETEEKEGQEKTIYLRDDAPVAPVPLPPEASEGERKLKQAEQAIYSEAQENGKLEDNPGYVALVSDANVLAGAQFGPGAAGEVLHFGSPALDVGDSARRFGV